MMRDGERIRVTYTVIDPETKREWRDLVEGSVTNLFGVQDDVADSVARNLDLAKAPSASPSTRPSRSAATSKPSDTSAATTRKNRSTAPSRFSKSWNLAQRAAALARAYLGKFQITRQPQLAATASRAAERALEGDPQSIDVNVTLGELRRRTGRYPEAVAAYLLVLSQQPNNADAVLGLAETYKASGDATKAEAEYKRAIALQPGYWSGYNKLGVFYYTQGRYADAISQFQKVVQLVPDNQRGYVNLGGMYQRLGRYDDAIRTFSESIARQPSGQAYSNLGTALYYAARYEEAAAAFEKAIELRPRYYVYWRNLGAAYTARVNGGRKRPTTLSRKRSNFAMRQSESTPLMRWLTPSEASFGKTRPGAAGTGFDPSRTRARTKGPHSRL